MARQAADAFRDLVILAAVVFAAAYWGFWTAAEPARTEIAAGVARAGKRGAAVVADHAALYWLAKDYAPGDARLVDVVGAGDVMMGARDYGLNPDIGARSDVAALVGPELPALFRRADIAFANLEGALYDGDDATAKSCDHCYAFRSPTAYARLLSGLGLTTLGLANNHSGDFGEEGRASTMAALTANGLAYCGLDRDGARWAERRLRDGRRAAIVAFAPNSGTLDINDLDAAAKLIRALKAGHALVVVSFHGGGEGEEFLHVSDVREYFHGEDRGNVVRFAHAAIDAGADLVLGQGPHVPRALELYRGRLIAYSLGNFWTYGAIDTAGIRGTGPVLEAWLAPDGTLAGLALHSTEERDSGVPHLDAAGDAAHLVLDLTRSDFPDTAARLEAAGESRTPRS